MDPLALTGQAAGRPASCFLSPHLDFGNIHKPPVTCTTCGFTYLSPMVKYSWDLQESFNVYFNWEVSIVSERGIAMYQVVPLLIKGTSHPVAVQVAWETGNKTLLSQKFFPLRQLVFLLVFNVDSSQRITQLILKVMLIFKRPEITTQSPRQRKNKWKVQILSLKIILKNYKSHPSVVQTVTDIQINGVKWILHWYNLATFDFYNYNNNYMENIVLSIRIILCLLCIVCLMCKRTLLDPQSLYMQKLWEGFII